MRLTSLPLHRPLQFLVSHRAELVEALRKQRCPFINLPDYSERQWREGMTAAKMALCRWLDPFIVARVEFLEWTPDNRLGHPRLAGIRSDKDARELLQEEHTVSVVRVKI